MAGFGSARQARAARGAGERFFAGWVRTGSHAASVEALLAGAVDAAALDSVALAGLARSRPDRRAALRVVATLGPFPTQPVVVAAGRAAELRRPLAAALLTLPAGPGTPLAELGLAACVPVAGRAFAGQRRALRALGVLPR